ncbi:PD-(D/E)XK nuclease domain-containing protein [Vreelandella aquamarina]|uniref:PD-(D/E)XK nuclease domain-containing protein n=1 Tax=Vreelandella aquamarina TaxID=77097 RepID=UPI00384B9C3B
MPEITVRVDIIVDSGGHFYIFKTKVVEQLPEGSKALEQIKAKGYADKYFATGRSIHLTGVEFSSEKRQFVAFEIDTIC